MSRRIGKCVLLCQGRNRTIMLGGRGLAGARLTRGDVMENID